VRGAGSIADGGVKEEGKNMMGPQKISTKNLTSSIKE